MEIRYFQRNKMLFYPIGSVEYGKSVTFNMKFPILGSFYQNKQIYV